MPFCNGVSSLNLGRRKWRPFLMTSRAASARLIFNSPTQRKVASSARGWSKRGSAMTYKVVALEFVVPSVLAIALAIVLSIGAVPLIDNYLGPMDQAEANYSAAGRD